MDSFIIALLQLSSNYNRNQFYELREIHNTYRYRSRQIFFSSFWINDWYLGFLRKKFSLRSRDVCVTTMQRSTTKTRGNALSFVTLFFFFFFRDREREGETREKANEERWLFISIYISYPHFFRLCFSPLMLYPAIISVLVCSYSSAGRRPLVVG